MQHRSIRNVLGVGAFLAFVASPAARAQDVSASPDVGTPFDRRRTVAVAERVQIGYEELGTRAGAFLVYPRIRTFAAFDDNVLARPDARRSDGSFTLEPSLRAVADWARHQAGVTAAAALTRFARLKSEDSKTFNLRGEGRYDIGDDLRLYGFAGYRRDVERRSAPGALRDSRHPAGYNTASTGARLTWQGSRLRLAADASATRIDYADVVTNGGVTIDSRELDRQHYQAGVRADYAVTANLAVLVTGSISKADYDLPPNPVTTDRSARKAELLGGVSFEFTDLLRGEIAAGYIDQDFSSPAIRDFSGFGGRAQIEYFPTLLTTFRLEASRTLQEAGNPLAPSYHRTRIGARVDHELYRYVLVSAFADYESDRFQLPARTERRSHLGMSGQYLLDRHVTLFARYDYLRVSSHPSVLGRRLSDNVLMFGILFKP